MTRSIRAISLTTRVNQWLSGSYSPRILHVFDRACNLIDEHRQVLSIVMSEIGNGPFNLVVDNIPNFTDHIHLGSPVSNTANELHIGSLVVETQRAKLWNARPDWKTLHANRVSIRQQTVALPGIRSPGSDLQFSSSLSSSLAMGDLPASVSAAKKLAGLGQGLTPSGDDYVLGAIYAAWIIHPQEAAEQLAHELADTTAPHTTSLSGAWLRAAGSGEAGSLWHAFLESLLHGEQNGIKQNVSNILSVGATSGADALAGFINTFISHAELERKHVVPKVL